MKVSRDTIEDFQRDGFVVVRRLFGRREVDDLRAHYMAMRAEGPHPGDFPAQDPTSDDPLKRFPRMIHMHRWDKTTWSFFTDRRLRGHVEAFLGGPPRLLQTMIYFKPPGARGQAPHQDQFYFRASPGTTMGAWMALDRADEANGCLRMVPGSHRYPLVCTHEADPDLSFTDSMARLPDGIPFPAQVMDPGDVLFFEGHVLHGSDPNVSDRFRRALIAHYVSPETQQIGEDYHPVLDAAGNEVSMRVSPEGGPCHEWVERDGQWVLELCEKSEQRSGTRRAVEQGGKLP